MMKKFRVPFYIMCDRPYGSFDRGMSVSFGRLIMQKGSLVITTTLPRRSAISRIRTKSVSSKALLSEPYDPVSVCTVYTHKSVSKLTDIIIQYGMLIFKKRNGKVFVTKL